MEPTLANFIVCKSSNIESIMQPSDHRSLYQIMIKDISNHFLRNKFWNKRKIFPPKLSELFKALNEDGQSTILINWILAFWKYNHLYIRSRLGCDQTCLRFSNKEFFFKLDHCEKRFFYSWSWARVAHLIDRDQREHKNGLACKRSPYLKIFLWKNWLRVGVPP